MPLKGTGGRPHDTAVHLETIVPLPPGPLAGRAQLIPQPPDPGESPMTATTIVPATLAEVLAYRHPGVVRRYAREQHVSREEAEEVFREMLKWLYLCGRGLREDVACAMTAEIARLDEMWHTFLMFTRDYADFCERYFGFFLHHVPNEDEEEVSEGRAETVREQFERQFGLVYDVLGEDTLRRWYEEERYAAATPGRTGPETRSWATTAGSSATCCQVGSAMAKNGRV